LFLNYLFNNVRRESNPFKRGSVSTIQVLESVDAVINELGGNTAVSRITGVPTSQAVWQWRNRGLMPPRFYLLMKTALEARNCSASPSLWGMVEGVDGQAH